MSASIRDITYQLRQGQLIALADETGWSVAADPINDAAVAQLLTLQPAMAAGQQPTVLIQNTDQLVLYVAKLPDVAYDLVEFAENPLTVVYQQGKNVSATLATASPVNGAGALAIRRSLNAEVQRLIGGFGRGLLTLPFESLTLPPAAEAVVAAQFGALPAKPQRPRLMRLDTDGGVGFIRK